MKRQLVYPDNIALEALQYCKFDDIILKYANEVLMNHDKHKLWSTCHIIPVPKSGNLNDVNNYYKYIKCI